jgi:hypothetical protein
VIVDDATIRRHSVAHRVQIKGGANMILASENIIVVILRPDTKAGVVAYEEPEALRLHE